MNQPEPFLFENVSRHDTTTWAYAGVPIDVKCDMPEAGWLTDGQQRFPFAKGERGIWAFVHLPGNSKLKLVVSQEERKLPDFNYHPFFFDKVQDLFPTIWLGERTLPLNFVSVSCTEPYRTTEQWHFRGVDEQRKVVVDLWLTICTQFPTIEWTMHATYGCTDNDGQAQAVDLPALEMTTLAPVVVDFAARTGIAPATWSPEQKRYRQRLLDPRRWHRASTWAFNGALMPAPDKARAQGFRVFGLYLGWANDWMALSFRPQRTPELESFLYTVKHDYLGKVGGNYVDQRARTQPRESGTTGEQQDFGCASDLAVTCESPWEIHDALYQCQSYALRPVHNKDRDNGAWGPMQAAAHPLAETMNQRPDLNLGAQDRLGWPAINQIGWIPSTSTTLWTTSDDQHRSDNMLYATIALTRDPGLIAIAKDHLELHRTDVYVRRPRGMSSRAIGRRALSLAHAEWCGIPGALEELETFCKQQLRFGWLSSMEPTKEVQTLGGSEPAKYGWNDANGQMVIGWQPWQEAIACIGLEAATRVGVEGLTAATINIGLAIEKQGWHPKTNQHAYAVRFNSGDMFPLTSWPLPRPDGGDASTGDIYVSNACDYWTAAASHILHHYTGNQHAWETIERFDINRASVARWLAL